MFYFPGFFFFFQTLLQGYPQWNLQMRKRLQIPIKIVYGEEFLQLLEVIEQVLQMNKKEIYTSKFTQNEFEFLHLLYWCVQGVLWVLKHPTRADAAEKKKKKRKENGRKIEKKKEKERKKASQ